MDTLTTLLLAATLLFPGVEGKNLEGKRYTLPQDFEGEVNILLVAFHREQQMLVDTWLPLVRQMSASRPGVWYYELPTISRTYSFMRPVIDGGMRRGIEDQQARERTITLYTGTGDFRKQLDLPTHKNIYVLLVDKQGYVRWKTAGELTPVAAHELEQAVSELLKTP